MGRLRRQPPESVQVFNFALVSTDGEALGSVVFARRDVRAGDLIPRRRGLTLRVVEIIQPERRDELQVLVVERCGA